MELCSQSCAYDQYLPWFLGVFKERTALLWPISLSSFVLSPVKSCDMMWIDCNYQCLQLAVFIVIFLAAQTV